jgi:hypothetical protein
VKFNKMFLNDVQFYSIRFWIKKRRYMLASGWSFKKGDWWYREKPENKKFFSTEKHISDKTINYGIYIGRLGLCLMIDK